MTANTAKSYSPLTHPQYRADIDGLRALAVLLVVGFHAFPYWIKGGFIGVDVFFIISGFLISTIIFNNLEKNTFSLIEFYRRRIKRIFPALMTVLLTVYLLGWFLLLGEEYKQLGKHIAGGASFISNFILWGENGYFDNIAETKPLLHLWSLGIEEQFYIFWPLLLCFAWKKRWNFLTITLSLAFISFALNIFKIRHHAMAAFYSPQTRFWELLIGATLAYIVLYQKKVAHQFSSHSQNALSIIGVLLLITGLILIDKDSKFPGWWALFPVAGASLMIAAGQHAWINRVILSNKVMVWFGLISFPLYLWHWPLLSIARIMESETPSRMTRILIVLCSVLLAWFTYKLIETPIRFGQNRKLTPVTMVFCMIIVGSLGFNCFKQDGFSYRFKELQEFAEYYENAPPKLNYNQRTGLYSKFRLECDFYDLNQYLLGQSTQIPLAKISRNCFVKDKTIPNTVLIWGDSHAQQLYYGLKNNLPKTWQILQVASSSCPPNVTIKKSSSINYCDQSNWFALKTIKGTKPDVVIVAQNKGHSAHNFAVIAAELKELGVKKVIFTGPTPHWTSDLPKIVLKQLWNNTPKRTEQFVDSDILRKNAKLQERIKSTDDYIFVNIIDTFCNNEGCLTYLGQDKKMGLTSYDYGHLTPAASDYLARKKLAQMVVDNKKPAM